MGGPKAHDLLPGNADFITLIEVPLLNFFPDIMEA
jgi:hypothetical protein